MMKSYRWLALALLVGFGGASAQTPDLRERVEQARRDDVPAADVTRWLIGQGERAEEAVQIVASVYGNCQSTTRAVEAATAAAPRAAESIVVAVAGLEDCGCTADTMWARSRLEERLRLPVNRRLLELRDPDACAAAATQGAVFELPERSGSLVEAALIAKQESLLPEDTVGWVDRKREVADWSRPLPLAATAFRRLTDVCGGDRDPRDRFVAAETWEAFDPANADPRAPWDPECDRDDDGEIDEPPDQVLIAEFVVGSDRPNYVKIYNGSEHPITLDRLGYRLLVSAPGSEVPETMVPLRGEVSPRGVFVIGDERMPPGTVDQLVPGLALRRGDALIVDLGWEARTCDSVTAIVAGAFRAGQDEEPTQAEVSKSALIRYKLARHFGSLERQIQGYVADAVGQVPLTDDEPEIPPLGSPLARLPTQCQPDGNETNQFDAIPPWQLSDGTTLGAYPPQCPPSDEPRVVLSEVINGEEKLDAVEVFNGTPAWIDLNRGGYYLEIFRNGERRPSEVIQLEGVVAPGATFVVANPDADEQTRELHRQLTDELDLVDASAVLLVRAAVSASRQCDQIALAALLGPSDIVFVPVPGDEAPNRVDPIASPN